MLDPALLIRKKAVANLLSWENQIKIAEETGFSIHKIEELALAQGILPTRYQRNIHSISIFEQEKLCQAKVAVIGCGGLGGYIIEELARLGIGNITALDYDIFDEHNLNRQVLSTTNVIGQNKVAIAAQRVKLINPAVQFKGYNIKFDQQNGREFLRDQHLVIDALDSITTRRVLSNLCTEFEIPLVHGAIAGWYGQVATQFPGEHTLERLYGNSQSDSDKGIETVEGNLAFTAAVIASLEVSEVIKIILARGELLRKKILFINLLDMEFDIIEL